MTIFTHHTRRLITVFAATAVLLGLGGTTIAAQARPASSETPATNVQATTAWLASQG